MWFIRKNTLQLQGFVNVSYYNFINSIYLFFVFNIQNYLFRITAIAYNILYENVFEISQVPAIVQAMLYEKPPLLTTNTDFFSEENIEMREKCIKMEETEAESVVASNKALQAPVKPDNVSDLEFMLQTNLAPFPFKVAKALDPSIYRNIEYDTWTEIRKGN